MPEAGGAVRPNAGCPRCGAAFHCGAREAGCACEGIALDGATLAALRDAYVGCLCLRCLRELAGQATRGNDAPAPGVGRA